MIVKVFLLKSGGPLRAMVVIQSGGNLSPNWSQLNGNVTRKKVSAIKDIWSNSGQVGGKAGKLS
jgi:hypothetical protein